MASVRLYQSFFSIFKEKQRKRKRIQKHGAKSFLILFFFINVCTHIIDSFHISTHTENLKVTPDDDNYIDPAAHK